MFGEKYHYTDEICRSLHLMNTSIIEAVDPLTVSAVFDIFPFLLKVPFILPSAQKQLAYTQKLTNDFTQGRIDEAKVLVLHNPVLNSYAFFSFLS